MQANKNIRVTVINGKPVSEEEYILYREGEAYEKGFKAGKEERDREWLLISDPEKARDNFTRDIIIRARAQVIKEMKSHNVPETYYIPDNQPKEGE